DCHSFGSHTIDRYNPSVQKTNVACAKDVFACDPKQPERHIARIVGSYRHWHTMANNAVGNRAVGANFAQRVTENLAHNLGIAEDKWKHMLQRIARCALKSHHVLINARLRNDVVMKEV